MRPPKSTKACCWARGLHAGTRLGRNAYALRLQNTPSGNSTTPKLIHRDFTMPKMIHREIHVLPEASFPVDHFRHHQVLGGSFWLLWCNCWRVTWYLTRLSRIPRWFISDIVNSSGRSFRASWNCRRKWSTPSFEKNAFLCG